LMAAAVLREQWQQRFRETDELLPCDVRWLP
jgi:hypothetical protein